MKDCGQQLENVEIIEDQKGGGRAPVRDGEEDGADCGLRNAAVPGPALGAKTHHTSHDWR